MRYPVPEKLEIIRLVEPHLPAKRTLDKLGIPRSTFNRWYDRFLTGGVDALEDHKPQPRRVWNRIPDETRGYFVSESSVYRLLKANDRITSPAFIVIKAHTSSISRRWHPTSFGRPIRINEIVSFTI